MLSHTGKSQLAVALATIVAASLLALSPAVASPRRAGRPRRGDCKPLRLTRQPINETVTEPGRAVFRAAVARRPGCQTPVVTWQLAPRGAKNFRTISGSRSEVLTVARTGEWMSGSRYRALFRYRAGLVITRVATLTVRSVQAYGTSAPVAGSPDRLFAATSVWNQPLSADAPLDPSSPARVSWLLNYINPPGPGTWINWSQYSVPVYRVPAGQPTTKVTLDNSSPALQQAWEAVPIPPSATPAPGSDALLVVYQPSADKMWEFWRLRRQTDGFHATWGGAMAGVSTNGGYFSPAAWPGPDAEGEWTWGSSASSLPAAAGLMTIGELRAGVIRHALSVALPQACSWFVWPAQRTDGTSTDPACLPEGAHLRLDPALDLSTLDLPPIALMMARAMQTYGLIVHDTTNSSVAFSAEQPTDGSDPYDGPGGIFDGQQEWQFLPKIPWSHLQLLKLGSVCEQAPCSGPGG
ncbi:MAG: hypothetical protein JO156_05500 [Solirubrobacterales bacterium]|nr:hypothetical protein [Solirubrobacterales bacterium]